LIFFSFQYDDRLSMIKYLSFTNNVSSPINHFPPGFFLFAFRIQLMYIFSLHSLACRCIHLRIYRTREGKKRKENRLWLLKTISFFFTLLSPIHTFRDTFSRLFVCLCRSFFSIKYLQNNYRTRNHLTDWWNREASKRERERKKRREKKRRRTRSISDYIIDYWLSKETTYKRYT
jgi:hypothetical protein